MKKLFDSVFDTHKYLFADLDGTIIHTKSGRTFPKDKDDWVIDESVVEAIKNYNPKFFFIVSNQGGIEKGFVRTEDFIEKIKTILRNIQTAIPGLLTTYRFCASNDKNNNYRKPNSGMVDDLLDVYKCKKNQCLMIGDASGKPGQFSDSDKICAYKAGISYMDVNDFIKEYGR